MGVPGLQSFTSKYQVRRDSNGHVIKGRPTIDQWAGAKKTLETSTRSGAFSSLTSGSPTTTKMYGTGASRLGKFGYEKDSNGRIRSNQDYSAWRTHSSTTVKPTVINGASNSASSCVPTGGGNDIASIASAAKNVYSVLNETGVLDKLKGSSNGDGKGSTGTVKEGVTADMENAKDSAALKPAIEEAKAAQTAIPSKIASAEAAVNDLSSKTDGLKTAADKAQAEYDGNLDAIKGKSGEVNIAKQSVEAAQRSYDSIKSMYGSANLGQQALMEEKLQSAFTALEKAKAALTKKQAELQALQDKTSELKQAAGDAKDAYDNNVKTIETKQQEVKDLKEQKEKLAKELPKQEARLKKLQEKEDKQLTELNKDINKYEAEQQQVNSKDVEKYDKLQKKIDGLREERSSLQDTIAMRNLEAKYIGGHCFQSGKVNGKDVYLVGGQQVSKADYDKLYNLAIQNSPNANVYLE